MYKTIYRGYNSIYNCYGPCSNQPVQEPAHLLSVEVKKMSPSKPQMIKDLEARNKAHQAGVLLGLCFRHTKLNDDTWKRSTPLNRTMRRNAFQLPSAARGHQTWPPRWLCVIESMIGKGAEQLRCTSQAGTVGALPTLPFARWATRLHTYRASLLIQSPHFGGRVCCRQGKHPCRGSW